jgi:hypothetical protein
MAKQPQAGKLYAELTGTAMFYFPIKFIKKTSRNLEYEFQTLTIDLDEEPSEQATVQSTFFFDNSGETKLTTVWKKLIIRSCFRLAEVED